MGCALESARVLPQPRVELVERDCIAIIEGQQKPDHLVLVGGQREPVDSQEGVGDREGSALVAVDERVVLRQALPQGRGFGDEVGVVAGLGPEEGRLKLTWIVSLSTLSLLI